MPLLSPNEISANDAHLHATAEVNGGDGKFVATENRVGCYCYDKTCFGDESGSGCWWCGGLATEKGDGPDEVDPSVCCFECNICR